MALRTCSAVPSSFSHALLAWQLSRAALSVPCPLPASSTASVVSVEWPPRGSGGPSRVMCGQPSAGASLVSQPGLSDGQPTGQPVSQDTQPQGHDALEFGSYACVLSELIVTYSQGGHCPLCTHMPGGGIIASHWSTVFTVASYLER